MWKKFMRIVLVVSFVTSLLAIAAALLVGMFFYIRFTRDLPRIDQMSDYRPKAVTSIYADDGTLVAEMYDERRYPVRFDEIPPLVVKAFLAAEDANFYSHPGIDVVSIFRALWKNAVSKKTKQGASTITQQIVKSLLLSREKTYERKAKEAILSYRLEKALSKDEILSIYLNEIFLGSGAYGVRAAAKVHFHKELNQLTLSEIAFLAGLPQKPTDLTNSRNHGMAVERQHYVLQQMLKNLMITPREFENAMQSKLIIQPPEAQNVYAVPYYAGHVIKELKPIFDHIDPNLSATNPGGYIVQTAANIHAHELATRSLQRGLREVDKRRGWRGPVKNVTETSGEASSLITSSDQLQPGELYEAVIQEIDRGSGITKVLVGKVPGVLNVKKASWARQFRGKEDQVSAVEPEKLLKSGQRIHVSIDEDAAKPPESKETQKKDPKAGGTDEKAGTKNPVKSEAPVPLKLDQHPELEGAMVVANALTGEVKVMIGGYSYKDTQFNRATQAALQPGSSFKPFIYLAALEHLHFTPVTIVPDSPISLTAGDGKLWTPQNFDHKYLGPITLRTALERSRNVVSVYMIQKMGVERAIQSARKLGISTPIQPNLSIALGTPEVHLNEMVRAYGAFAAEGWLAESIYVKSIKDRDGHVIYEQPVKQTKVIADEEAFLIANMMKGVVERGTATAVKPLGRPVAGKTGTTNDQMDAWFIGYTPEWVAGIWIGFDVKRQIGRMETGGKVAAPVFLYFMQAFLKDEPVLDFTIPDGVIPMPIDLGSGVPVAPDSPGAFIEYFKTGTEPNGTGEAPPAPQQEYLTNDEF